MMHHKVSACRDRIWNRSV